MATKKITDLTKVDSLSDSDLLLVETADGTRAVAKDVIISNDERERIAQTGYVAQAEPPENTSLLWLDTDDMSSEAGVNVGYMNITLPSANWVQDTTYGNVYKQVASEIQDLIFADRTAIHCFESLAVKNLLKSNGVQEIRIENQDGIPMAYLTGKPLTIDITIQVHIITI